MRTIKATTGIRRTMATSLIRSPAERQKAFPIRTEAILIGLIERLTICGTQKVVHRVRGTELRAVNKFSDEREYGLV